MTRYCPSGHGAFEDWVKRCPECGRSLTDHPPSGDGTSHDGEVVRLVTAPNEPVAMMWADTLRAEGIQVMLRAGGPGAGVWASSATFEHDLFVRDRDLDQARVLVRTLLTGGGAMTRPLRRRQSPPRANPVRKPGS